MLNKDNKVERTSDWLLIDDNIDGSKTEYTWTAPNIYSNQVKIKVVGMKNNNIYEAVSDTQFTIYFKDILLEEQKYIEKYEIGNKWKFRVIKKLRNEIRDEYYILKEVTESKEENGIKSYNINEITFNDTIIISTNNYWKDDRVHYSPEYILQDGDGYDDVNYFLYDDNMWQPWKYFYKKCFEHDEEVLFMPLRIKEYKWGVSESGITDGLYKLAKDFGQYYSFTNSEGYRNEGVLIGAYIDGVLYGDTITVQ